MAKIKITPENLESQAKTLREYNASHATEYGKMKTLVNNLVAEWEGEAQTAFKNSFDQRDTQFKKFEEDIEGFAKLMDEAARQMRQTEEALTNRMQQGV